MLFRNISSKRGKRNQIALGMMSGLGGSTFLDEMTNVWMPMLGCVEADCNSKTKSLKVRDFGGQNYISIDCICYKYELRIGAILMWDIPKKKRAESTIHGVTAKTSNQRYTSVQNNRS